MMRTNKWILIFLAIAVAGVLVIGLTVGSQKVEIVKQIPADEIQYIEIFNDSWDVEVKPSTDNQVHVDIKGKQKDKKKIPVTVTHQDHKLIIQQTKQMGGAFSAFTWGKEGAIQISIPQNAVEQVALTSDDGDIHIHGLSLPRLMVQDRAGYVKLNEVEADVLTAFSKTGDIVLKRVDEQGEMNIETETGDIQVVYQTAPSSLKLEVENIKGDTTVHLENLSHTTNTEKEISGIIGAGENAITVRSRSGNIDIK
ncbi:MAG TPA: DUF4097 family beta strand repeat-containing protein [Paenibacillus sp.]|jgi:DUF4097 and DUF4098 domain-containing protein YvlB